MSATPRDLAEEIVGTFTFGPGVEDAVVDSIRDAMDTIRDRIAAVLTRAEAERDAYAKSNVSALIALNSAFAHAEALVGVLVDMRAVYCHERYGSQICDRADAALAAWRAPGRGGEGDRDASAL